MSSWSHKCLLYTEPHNHKVRRLDEVIYNVKANQFASKIFYLAWRGND
jgi:hypothetical protein